ncbi:MAG: magnesium transporter [Candidatus Omnitrophota bacterium]|jgi:magnesium transporter|nr:MAG: magnesium transporter [Candidatus Omnitrophota bacterium]
MQTKVTQNRNIKVYALFLPEIKELLQAKDFNSLKEFLKTVHSLDLPEILKSLEPAEKILVFRLLGTKKAVEVFENLRFDDQNYILNNLESQEVSQIINEMAPDERADLFKELPSKVFRKFFALINKEEAQDLKNLMVYEEGTAGSLMTTDFVSLKKDMTAKNAIISIQQNLRADYRENIYSVFVTDDNRKLLGHISLQDLLKAPPDILVKDIMGTNGFIKIYPNTTKEDVAAWFKQYDLLDAAVIDDNGILVGIITVDDIVAEMEKQTTKDIYEIGKMDARGGEIISYASATTFELVRRRAGWLVLLLIFDFLTGTVLKNFEHTLSAVVALTFFIPMLLDTGGNAGAQTSITIIRGLATGDVNFKNVFKVIRLEFSSAFLMGIIIGSVAFARALLLQKDFHIALVVGLSMVAIAILAICTGVFLPLFSKKIGLDPASLAGPITTSVVDVVGLIIYFKIAQAFIPALNF